MRCRRANLQKVLAIRPIEVACDMSAPQVYLRSYILNCHQRPTAHWMARRADEEAVHEDVLLPNWVQIEEHQRFPLHGTCR
jgi:hypothetical protein